MVGLISYPNLFFLESELVIYSTHLAGGYVVGIGVLWRFGTFWGIGYRSVGSERNNKREVDLALRWIV